MDGINIFYYDGLLDSLFKHIKQSGDYQTFKEVKLYLHNLGKFGLTMNEKFKKRSVKHLKSDVYYLRPKKIRIYFTIISEKEYHLLSWYNKKSKKSPKQEIDKALKLSKKVKKQLNNKKV